MITAICSDVVEIIEPAKEGYQLTLRLDFSKLPSGKGLIKSFMLPH
jgi:actin related protein 2/3 complex subunit 2